MSFITVDLRFWEYRASVHGNKRSKTPKWVSGNAKWPSFCKGKKRMPPDETFEQNNRTSKMLRLYYTKQAIFKSVWTVENQQSAAFILTATAAIKAIYSWSRQSSLNFVSTKYSGYILLITSHIQMVIFVFPLPKRCGWCHQNYSRVSP